MRLYATITSERASKGQGGNEAIKISLKGAHGTEIVSLMFKDDGAGYSLSGWTHDNHRIEHSISENMQKGEKTPENIAKWLENGEHDKLREEDYIPKGERQKGEHALKILSLHDAQAECSGCGWYYAFTGEKTRQEVEAEYKKAH